ncbi:hypothetical protein PT974_05463 [Cladobotryum mycophilum]|uniref:BTB domain-containing protein n=1 Tax=Cladobotryum mycophilum TaxID=491253 RepID=A0ABR0SIT1_9HYPO
MKLDDTTSNAIQAALKEAETGVYSDLTITCGRKEYHVHKVLLCTRSSFFKRICDGPFKEGLSNTINLPDDDPEAVDSMMCYIYNGYYPRKNHGTHRPLGEEPETFEITAGFEIEFLTLHVKVYALAEKYDIPDLKKIALRGFQLLSNCNAYNKVEFANVCELAYTTTVDSDRGLRDAIIKTLYDNPKALDEEHIQAMLKQVPELSYDYIMHHREAQKNQEKKIQSFQPTPFRRPPL